MTKIEGEKHTDLKEEMKREKPKRETSPHINANTQCLLSSVTHIFRDPSEGF